MAWLAAKCPVSEKARVWIEDSLDRLCREFGEASLRGEVLDVPVEAVQIEMDDDPGNPELQLRVPIVHKFSGAAGHFQRRGDAFVVTISRGQLPDLIALTATLAHELAHVRLLGEQRISRDRSDQEQLTDLATVFFGLGVFTANAAFDYSHSQRGWQTSHLGYLGEAMFGYALAAD